MTTLSTPYDDHFAGQLTGSVLVSIQVSTLKIDLFDRVQRESSSTIEIDNSEAKSKFFTIFNFYRPTNFRRSAKTFGTWCFVVW